MTIRFDNLSPGYWLWYFNILLSIFLSIIIPEHSTIIMLGILAFILNNINLSLGERRGDIIIREVKKK